MSYVDPPFTPGKYGSTLGLSPETDFDTSKTDATALALGRPLCLVDGADFECEIIAGCVSSQSGEIAYVESRSQDRGQFTDVTIKVHHRTAAGDDRAVDIESYNPYFGCDVAYLDWFDDTALLIYTEKHRTYACCFGAEWPPRFAELDYRWSISESTIAFVGYKKSRVQRLAVPLLEPLPELTLDDAIEAGLLSPEHDGG